MTKELTPLEAWEKIKNITSSYEQGFHSQLKDDYVYEKEVAVIETALKRLEKIDKRDSMIGHIEEIPTDIVSRKLKALEIIKNKLMYELEPFDFMDYDTYEDYYQNYFEQSFEEENNFPDWWLTKEEFELLKDAFGKKHQNL